MDQLFTADLPDHLKPGADAAGVGELLNAYSKEADSLAGFHGAVVDFAERYQKRCSQVIGLPPEETTPFEESATSLRKVRARVLGGAVELALCSGAFDEAEARYRALAELGEDDAVIAVRAAVDVMWRLERVPGLGQLPDPAALHESIEVCRQVVAAGHGELTPFADAAARIADGYAAIFARDEQAYASRARGLSDDPAMTNGVLRSHAMRLPFLKFVVDGLADGAFRAGELLLPTLVFTPGSQVGLYHYHLAVLFERAHNTERAASLLKPFYDHGVTSYQDFLLDEPVNPSEHYRRLVGDVAEQSVLTVDMEFHDIKEKDLQTRVDAFTRDGVCFSDAVLIARDMDKVNLTARTAPITLEELLAYMRDAGEKRRLTTDLVFPDAVDLYGLVVGGNRQSQPCIHITPRPKRNEVSPLDDLHFVIQCSGTGIRFTVVTDLVLKMVGSLGTNARAHNQRVVSRVVALQQGRDAQVEATKSTIFDFAKACLGELSRLESPYVSVQLARKGVPAVPPPAPEPPKEEQRATPAAPAPAAATPPAPPAPAPAPPAPQQPPAPEPEPEPEPGPEPAPEKRDDWESLDI